MSAILSLLASINPSGGGGGGAPTPDLVWWQLAEGAGTSVGDSSTAGTNTGTVTGATWVPGKNGVGNALDFDGTDDFLVSAANLTFGVKKCTVCAWAYIPAFADNDAVLWEHSVNQNSNQNTFVAIPNAASGLFNATYRGNGYRSETIARPAPGYWRHIACTYDVETTTAADVEIYFDGVLQSTTVAVNTNSSSSNNIATLPTYFMGRGGASLFLKGKLYDVRIYKSKLTQPQIAAIMAESPGGQALCEDTFNRANENPLASTMSDGVGTWTSGHGAFADSQISSNDLTGTASNSGARVLSPTFTANQRATITLGSDNALGVLARMQSTSNGSGYAVLLANSTTVRIYRVTDSGSLSFTPLGADITVSTVVAGNTLGIECSGDTITALVNGASVGSRTDATYASGQPGTWQSAAARNIRAFTATDI